MLVISFRYHDSIHVDEEAISSWFPTLGFWTPSIDGEYIIDEIDKRISAYSTSASTIRTALKQFFEPFRPHFFASRTDHLSQRLERLLQSDMHVVVQISGLKGSRQNFLVLACLARTTPSKRLAEALVGFLSSVIILVMQHEMPYHLHEWGLALLELRGLVYDATLHQLLGYLMSSTPIPYNPWARKVVADPWRGRRTPKLLAAPADWLVPRARSAPGYRYRHSPDLRVGWPVDRYPRSAWNSPVLQPRVPDYFDKDEYEALQAEQDIQAHEVDELSRRVRQLEGVY